MKRTILALLVSLALATAASASSITLLPTASYNPASGGSASAGLVLGSQTLGLGASAWFGGPH